MPCVLLLDTFLPSADDHRLLRFHHELFVEMPIAFYDPCLIGATSVQRIQLGHPSEDEDHGATDSTIVGCEILRCCGRREDRGLIGVLEELPGRLGFRLHF